MHSPIQQRNFQLHFMVYKYNFHAFRTRKRYSLQRQEYFKTLFWEVPVLKHPQKYYWASALEIVLKNDSRRQSTVCSLHKLSTLNQPSAEGHSVWKEASRSNRNPPGGEGPTVPSSSRGSWHLRGTLQFMQCNVQRRHEHQPSGRASISFHSGNYRNCPAWTCFEKRTLHPNWEPPLHGAISSLGLATMSAPTSR